MSWVVAAVIVIAIAIAASVMVKLGHKEGAGHNGHPYTKAGPLFTPAERSFLGVLQQAVGEDAQVFGKVRVADVITPAKGLPRSDWQRAFNRIAAKHFDFIVCTSDDLSVVCALELNDASHQSKKRQQRDSFLEAVCSAAGIPLVQVEAKSGYVVPDIRALLAPYLGNEVASHSATQAPTSDMPPPPRACPKCASPLVKRTATRGKHAGDDFMACSGFPKCRYHEAVDV